MWIGTQTDRQRDMWITERQADRLRQTDRHVDRQTGRQTDMCIDRQADTHEQIDRHVDRQTDRPTDMDRHTYM